MDSTSHNTTIINDVEDICFDRMININAIDKLSAGQSAKGRYMA